MMYAVFHNAVYAVINFINECWAPENAVLIYSSWLQSTSIFSWSALFMLKFFSDSFIILDSDVPDYSKI